MYPLNKFSENGVSWPFSISGINDQNLEKKYFEFKEKANLKMKSIRLKPNLISKFLIHFVLIMEY